MGWNRNDGKRYVGKLSKVFISHDEVLSAEDYIDLFLRTRGYELSNTNRDTVAAKLEKLPDRNHHTISELNHWLDILFNE